MKIRERPFRDTIKYILENEIYFSQTSLSYFYETTLPDETKIQVRIGAIEWPTTVSLRRGEDSFHFEFDTTGLFPGNWHVHGLKD